MTEVIAAGQHSARAGSDRGPRPSGRARFVDLARAVAIFLALASHAAEERGTGGWRQLREQSETAYYVINMVASAATPSFILLFGISAELAHVRRWQKDPSGTRRRLVKRSFECWLALAAVGAAATVHGFPIRDAVESVLLVGPSRLGSIFAFYVPALLLMVLLVPLRRRVGLGWTLALVMAWWPVAALLQPFFPDSGDTRFFLSRMLGLDDLLGPSVLHALTLVVLGMVIGRVVLEARDGMTARLRFMLWAPATTAALGLVVLMAVHSPKGVLDRFITDRIWRASHHPGYYCVGYLLAAALLGVCYLVERRQRGRRVRRGRPGPFAGSALLAFALGNMLINLLWPYLAVDGTVPALLLAVGLVAALDVAMRGGRVVRSRLGV